MRLIFCVLFFIALCTNHGQSVLLNENFNSGFPAGWTLIDGDMANPYNDPEVNQLTNSFHLVADYDSTNTGDSVMAATSWFTDTINANNFLITPAINFPTNGNYLNFQAMSIDGSFPDGLQVYYSLYNNNVDSLMNCPVLFDTAAVPSLCTDFQVKLDSVPLNTDVYIVFRHYADDQFILTIDNVNIITNDLTSISINDNSGLNIYPNPSNGVVNFDAKSLTEKYQIFNGIGKLIWEGNIHKTMHLNLHSGWYIIKSNTTTQAFVVN